MLARFGQRVASVDPEASHILATREAHRRLQRAMQRLPTDAQIIIELHYWRDMPLKEIAQTVRIAPGTVKSRLGRARTRLRHLLAENGD
jgi:RNA polymerase sigma-70 factor (ECF subfamily)